MDDKQAQYNAKVARSRRTLVKEQPKRPVILDDMLLIDDWSVISLYRALLKPLKDATMKLQGHISGKFGAI